MNKVCLVGRLTKNIELRKTKDNTSVVSFTIAINRTFKNKEGNYDTDFINCIAFKNNAEYLSKYAHKGDMTSLSGSIQTRSYTIDSGEKRYAIEVITDNLSLIGSFKKDPQESVQAVAEDPHKDFGTSQEKVETSIRMEDIVIDDDSLPF